MPLPNITIEVITGGIGRTTNSEDNVALLVAFTQNTTNLPFRTGRVYRSLKSVEADNITDATDKVDQSLVWWHASEFFRLNPEGILHILLLDPGADAADLFDTAPAKPLWNYIQNQNGLIKQIGIAYNLSSSVNTHINTLANTTISVAQLFANSLAMASLWVDIIYLEGSNFDYTNINTVPGLFDPARLAPNVAVVIGQDFNKAEELVSSSKRFEGTACIGTVLGLSTNKNIHESFAQPSAKNNIQDTAYSNGDGRWLAAKIKTGVRLETLPLDDLDELADKGYVFPRFFPNFSGYYFSQSQNVMPETEDINSIELAQVINKVQRIAKQTVLPELNRTFPVRSNGRIIDIERKRIEGNIRRALEPMAENYSELVLVEVDPEKDSTGTAYPSFLITPTLRVIIGIRPLGKAKAIFIQIGYQQ